VLVEDRIVGTNISMHLTETADFFRRILLWWMNQFVQSMFLFAVSAGDESVRGNMLLRFFYEIPFKTFDFDDSRGNFLLM
ncbi:MAG: hypothetical protein JXI43_03230, partial [Tissierellales bacterium]|nr:hypothetical protein [Tissierellales bacterium]